MRFSPKTIMRLFKYWPPFLASGISVKEFDLDKGYVVSEMKLSKWNENYFGTMFGGSLFSMCDPFYVFILAHKLRKDFIIWDIEGNIKFQKATKKKVTARFEISDEQVQQIRKEAEKGVTVKPQFQTKIVDEDGNQIAEVTKTLFVKIKKKF